MSVKNEDILRWGDKHARAIVEDRDPRAHLRHIAWIDAGCPADTREETSKLLRNRRAQSSPNV